MFSIAKFLSSTLLLSPLVAQVACMDIRINPLGDSITGSPGCWRALLWQMLQVANVRNTTFVGTLPATSCAFTYDGENDGHGGYLATGIVDNHQLPRWLSVSKPDIVMMQLGTNDVWNAREPPAILEAFSILVGQMRAQKPSMRILVAQITPLNPNGCSDCDQRVINLNNVIPSWASTMSTSASPITVVDCWTGFSTTTDTYDGVHPNDSGDAKLANAWYSQLMNVILAARDETAITTTVAGDGGVTNNALGSGGTAPIYCQQCNFFSCFFRRSFDVDGIYPGDRGCSDPDECACRCKCSHSNYRLSQWLPAWV